MPAERQVVELVRARGLTPDGVGGSLFLSSTATDRQETWTVARTNRGECVFFDNKGGRLCLIHRELGESALPSACRHFPRQILHDARGMLISLSHFCPTAASTLLDGGTLAIVEARPPLLLTSRMEGLDARNALPPLVRPGLLCDTDGYAIWERLGVDVFARADNTYTQCLSELTDATELVRKWRPGLTSMSVCVAEAFRHARIARREHSTFDDRLIERVAALTSDLTGGDIVGIPDFDKQWDRRIGTTAAWFDLGMKRYLGARLFGNWIAYQGRGLRSVVEWLRTCAAVVRHFALRGAMGSEQRFDEGAFVEAVRSADLLLLHALDSAMFARAIATIEETDYA